MKSRKESKAVNFANGLPTGENEMATRKNSNAVAANSSVVNATKENEMNTSVWNSVYDARREFAAREFVPSLNLTKDQIMGTSVMPYLQSLFANGQIRLTNASRQTREEGIPVVFPNKVQLGQLGKALASAQFEVHTVWATVSESLVRQTAFLDAVGTSSRLLVERLGGDGYIDYEVWYADLVRDLKGNIVTLRATEVNPMQQSILDDVVGYNAWANLHNSVSKVQVGAPLSDEEKAAYAGATEEAIQAELAKMRKAADDNLFVRDNSVRTILFESVINKYALEAALVMDVSRPAFEIYSNARSRETTISFMEKIAKHIEYGYRGQLAAYSGVDLR